MITAETIIKICRECAAGIYGTREPSPRYAEATAQLLIGTAAHESHFEYRRQRGFSLERMDGAWGLWQTEQAAVGDNIRYLLQRQDVTRRASDFLFVGEGELHAILTMGGHGLMRLIHDDDRFACLMARVHYLRQPGGIPDTLLGQAAYWKKYYNTSAGKGTTEKYMADWRRFVAPYL